MGEQNNGASQEVLTIKGRTNCILLITSLSKSQFHKEILENIKKHFGCCKSHAKLVDNHEYGIISAVSAQSNYNIYFEIFILYWLLNSQVRYFFQAVQKSCRNSQSNMFNLILHEC